MSELSCTEGYIQINRHLAHTLSIIVSDDKNHPSAFHCSGYLLLLTFLIHIVRQPPKWLNKHGPEAGQTG